MEVSPSLISKLEAFRKVADLPPNCFIGTNNITSYLEGYMTFEELKALAFRGIVVQADGRWTVWK